MKRLLLTVFALCLMTGNLFALVDRYKTDVGADKTVNHITYVLPLHYAADRTNLEGSYTLATNIGGKNRGSLSFDFKQTSNKFSLELRNAILRIAKDLRETENPDVSISFTLASGEQFTFDGSYFKDWKKEEWNDILHVTYNEETEEYTSFIMFPLEYLKSNVKDLSGRISSRYDYVLKALSKHNLVLIQIVDQSRNANVKINIPIDRPTAETINHMLNKKTYAKERAKKAKNNNKSKSGRR